MAPDDDDDDNGLCLTQPPSNILYTQMTTKGQSTVNLGLSIIVEKGCRHCLWPPAHIHTVFTLKSLVGCYVSLRWVYQRPHLLGVE